MGKVLSYLGAVVVPLGAGALLYLWADWSLRRSATPAAVAVLVGVALTVAALAACDTLFRAGGGCLAVLLMVAGLAAVWVEVRDASPRSEVVDCAVVGAVKVTHHPSFGEGAPRSRTLFHHRVDCPGGYPAQFTAESRTASEGGTIRIAYDPTRRQDPVLASENVSHGSPVIPTALLTLSALTSLVTLARKPGQAPWAGADEAGADRPRAV